MNVTRKRLLPALDNIISDDKKKKNNNSIVNNNLCIKCLARNAIYSGTFISKLNEKGLFQMFFFSHLAFSYFSSKISWHSGKKSGKRRESAIIIFPLLVFFPFFVLRLWLLLLWFFPPWGCYFFALRIIIFHRDASKRESIHFIYLFILQSFKLLGF